MFFLFFLFLLHKSMFYMSNTFMKRQGLMGGIIGGGHRVINARTNRRADAQREMKGQLAACCPKIKPFKGCKNKVEKRDSVSFRRHAYFRCSKNIFLPKFFSNSLDPIL